MDCGSRLDCQLQLSSVYLPGNVLRRKTLNDELMMREYFTEGDLVCAEVSGGSIDLNYRHTQTSNEKLKISDKSSST